MKGKVLAIVIGLFILSASSVLAQDFCKGLADFDQDVDAGDVEEFLKHFGRSQYFNPCPPDGPAPVPKTGQTTSWATGDDGDLEKGVGLVTQRFTDNGNGTVTDHLTGLIWLKDANCLGYKTWNDVLTDANGLESGSCGLSDDSSAGDWRIPQLKELMSVFDLGNYSPALPDAHPFINVPNGSSNFWSSTTDSSWDIRAHFVYLTTGGTGSNSKTSLYIGWPVRGGH